jgi:DNA-binding MarR family transcriptional regulator
MIGAQLRAAAEAVHQAVYDRLAQAGHHHLRPSHLALLKFPGPHGSRPTELAARVGLRKQALNPLLNDLEELGYLQRTSDDEDKRGRILWLTPRGMSLMRIMRETLEEVESQLSDRLGAAGLQDFQLALGLVGEIAREVADSPQAVPS